MRSSGLKVIAAVVAKDTHFAANLARILVDRAAAKHGHSIQVPDSLECRREVSLHDATGADAGRIDLLFENEARSSACS
jgi:hypothetical protein